MSADEILFDAEERMEKAVDVLKKNLAGIRTGRANPGLVDSLRVEPAGGLADRPVRHRVKQHQNPSNASRAVALPVPLSFGAER